MRQLFIDTETTGLEANKGHRIIEFGAVEMIDRKLTSSQMHFYFKPNITVEPGSFKVHGISDEFLADKPRIEDKIDEIMHYIKGAELVIHNAAFDLSFLNAELNLFQGHHWGQIENHCAIVDTLMMARKKHPRQKNSLDALCGRYGVNNSHRELHGALRDAEILAQVYLMMTGGQIDLFNASPTEETAKKNAKNATGSPLDDSKASGISLVSLEDTPYNHEPHNRYLDMLDQKSNNNTLWRQLSASNN